MRSFTNLTQLYCRLECFNKSIKNKAYNLCVCHPNCKTLNFNPKYENKNIYNYTMYESLRKCHCDTNGCKVIHKIFDK